MDDEHVLAPKDEVIISATRESLFSNFHQLRQVFCASLPAVVESARHKRGMMLDLFEDKKQIYQWHKEKIEHLNQKVEKVNWGGVINNAEFPTQLGTAMSWVQKRFKQLYLLPTNSSLSSTLYLKEALRTSIVEDYQRLLILNTIPRIIAGTASEHSTEDCNTKESDGLSDYGPKFNFGLDFDDGFPT